MLGSHRAVQSVIDWKPRRRHLVERKHRVGLDEHAKRARSRQFVPGSQFALESAAIPAVPEGGAAPAHAAAHVCALVRFRMDEIQPLEFQQRSGERATG